MHLLNVCKILYFDPDILHLISTRVRETTIAFGSQVGIYIPL